MSATGLDTQEGFCLDFIYLKNQKVTVMLATHDPRPGGASLLIVSFLPSNHHRIVAFGNPNEVLQTENLLSA